jgi:hypothetical protein
MAANPQNNLDPKDLQQIQKYLEDSGLSAQDLANRMNVIKNNASEFARELENAQNAADKLKIEFNDLSATFKNVLNDLRKWDDTSNRINRSYAKLGGISDKLRYDARDLNVLSLQDLKNLDKKSKIELENLRFLKQDLDIKFKSNSLTEKEKFQYNELNGIFAESGRLKQDENNYAKTLLDLIQKRKIEELKIVQTLGITGKLVDGIVSSLSQLGISNEFFENLKEDMREAAKSGDKWKVVTSATKGLISGIGDALSDPVAKLVMLQKAFTFFLNAAITSNKQSVDLGKNLGYGAANADRVRANFVDIESSSNNLNVNTANLAEAFNELSTSTGFVTEYSADALETQIKLTKQLGLSGNEAAGVYKFSVLTGKSSEQTYQSLLRGYVATRNSLNVGVPFKAAMAEAAKVSGQLASNLGNNPETIIKAVVATRALGTSLEQAKSQGEKLLDFQSSIENELKAELITGEQLNLEKARYAALMGDQVAVAEELAAQGMTAAKFSGMNVIAQQSYAAALGTTSDELADQLAKREMAIASGKSLAQITAEEAEEAAERQDIQEKFNAAMLKLQSIVGNLLAGPLGSFLEMLSGALEIINYFATPLKIIGGLFLGIYGTMQAINLVGKAIAITEGLTASIIGQKVGYQSASVASKVAENAASVFGNAQAAIGLATEGSSLSFKQLSLALEGESLATKTVAYGLALKDLIVSRSKTAFLAIEKTGLIAINGLKTIGLAISRREALVSVGQAALAAFKGTLQLLAAKLGPFAIPVAAVAGASALGIGYSLMKDGIVDPNKGPVMSGGFGSVQMDPNDKAMYGADGKIKVGTNLLGDGKIESTKIETIKTSPPVDITPMVSAINQVTAAITKMNSKSWDVKLDSKSVGSGLMQNSYRSA